MDAIALAYEQLLQESNPVDARMDEYVEKLVGFMREAVPMPIVTADVVPVRFEIDRAIPLGLLLNELLTNCSEHAFPSRATGQVLVQLSEAGAQQFVLSVADNGVGLPDDLDTGNPATLGLQLVHSLAAQLRGVVSFSSYEGTRVTVRFPRE